MGSFFHYAAQNGPNTVVFSSRHWEDRYEANRSASIRYLFLFCLAFSFFLLQFFIFLCFICLEFWQFVAQGLFWSNMFAILDASCTLIGIFFFITLNDIAKIGISRLTFWKMILKWTSAFRSTRAPGYLASGVARHPQGPTQDSPWDPKTSGEWNTEIGRASCRELVWTAV